jgi:hypothetical protein
MSIVSSKSNISGTSMGLDWSSLLMDRRGEQIISKERFNNIDAIFTLWWIVILDLL